MIVKTAQIILTYANLKTLWQCNIANMLKEELKKNKPDELVVQFDLCDDLVICKDGKGLTLVVGMTVREPLDH